MTGPSRKIGGQYGEVRAPIDLEALNRYLSTNTKEIAVPVSVQQFQYGQSNPTYFLKDASGIRFVMRKKPSGELLSQTAHAVEREYRILAALQVHNDKPSTSSDARVPIPRPISLCGDKSILGTPFYIMEFLDGRIFADFKMKDLEDPDERRACWLSAVQTLATLASLSPDELGLSNFGPRTPFYPRQLKSLSKVSKAQAEITDVTDGKKVGEIPYFKDSMDWYAQNLPDESLLGSRIVHGDYKIDNIVFHPTEPRVIGILDWELCTLGNPLSDLGNLTLPFNFGPAVAKSGYLAAGFKGAPSADFPITLEEIEREYCKVLGLPYPIAGMGYVRSWMVFRLAIISQGIAARRARGQASSANAAAQGSMFSLLGEIARDIWRSAVSKNKSIHRL